MSRIKKHVMQKNTLETGISSSAFANTEADTGVHIIDTMIEERCPSFVSHWSWPVVRPFLFATLKYKAARQLIDIFQSLNGRSSFDYLADELKIDLNSYRLDRIPTSGRLIVAANHPTGLADGIAVWDAIRRVRRDVVFMANADAIRINPDFNDIIIPVEWVEDKRTSKKTWETLKLIKEALNEEKCVIIFPSGRLAKRINGKLIEQDWTPSVVSFARIFGAPVQPINVSAENSKLFYLLSAINGQLRDVMLLNELLNKKNARFDLNFGPLIESGQFYGDATALTMALRDYVSNDLQSDPDQIFTTES